MQACKSLFDLQIQLCDTNHCGLTELYIDGLDKEQVWQQIELVNNNWYKVIDEAKKAEKSKSKSVEEIPTLDKRFDETNEDFEEISDDDERVKQIMKKVRFADDVQDETNEMLSDDGICDDEEDEEGDSDEDNVDGEENREDENSENENSEDEFERKAKKPRLEANGYEDPLEIFKKTIRNSKKSENEDKVDDSKFFNISEMNAFLDKQDALEGKERNSDDSEDDEEESYDEVILFACKHIHLFT